MDKQTMRKFDEACLTPVRPLTAAEIKALSEREAVLVADAEKNGMGYERS
jgi:DNA-binding transcriptional regulator YiaG